MRKMILLLFVLFLSFNLSAEVYKTTKEITAYKNDGGTASSASSSTVEPQNVTLTLLNPSQASFDDGTDIPIPESSRNIAYTAFSWTLTGNLYNSVNIDFKFSPMYSGERSSYGNYFSSVSDQTKTIPYTVTLTHTSTKVTSDNTTRTIGTSAITSASRNTAFDTGTTYTTGSGYGYKVYINYADSVTMTNNSSTISTSSVTESINYNMSTNSYTWYRDYYYDYYEYEDYSATTCHSWTRSGYAVVTLKITNDGTWVDNSSMIIEEGSYKAYVTATISTN